MRRRRLIEPAILSGIGLILLAAIILTTLNIQHLRHLNSTFALENGLWIPTQQEREIERLRGLLWRISLGDAQAAAEYPLGRDLMRSRVTDMQTARNRASLTPHEAAVQDRVLAALESFQTLEGGQVPDTATAQRLLPVVDAMARESRKLTNLRRDQAMQTNNALRSVVGTLQAILIGAVVGLVLLSSGLVYLSRKAFHNRLVDLYAQAQQRTRELEATQAERQRLLVILEQAPAAICTLAGPEHVYTFTNTAYNRFIGRSDVLGMPVRLAVPEAAGQGFFELLDSVYATGVPVLGMEAPVQLDRHGTGVLAQVFTNYSFAPLRTSQEQITGVFIHVVDVTELVVARQAAEAAVVARDQFLSIAAHELRTPLTSLLGYSELLQRQLRRAGGLDPRTDAIQTVLERQGQRLIRLIDMLLDIARINMGQLSLERAPLDFGALTQQMVDELQVIAAGQPIHVILPPEACVILGDRLRLEQVVINLVQNALKYSPDGGAVTVTVGCAPGQVWMQVRDQGLGIPAVALPHLFERFYRVPHGTVKALPGMGLGLAVVHEIVTLHDGTITVESTEGQGSTFTVTLPRTDAGAPADAMEGWS